MRLNGWQRLAILFGGLWTPLAFQFALGLQRDWRNVPGILAVWLAPIAIVYALGTAIGWVARGFRDDNARV